jgi:Zn-dependent protease with chaperone function
MSPRKKELLADYQRAETLGTWVLGLETLIACLFFVFINHSFILKNLSESLILVGLAVVPTLLSLAYYFAKKKKRVEDLKPTVKYGHLSKNDLLEVCAEACSKMGIQQGDVSFYVTSEKQVNASALTLGLGSVFKNLQVVMLNRATLHALKKDELLSVVAHELAHIYRYPLRYHQALILRLFNSCLLNLSLFTLLPNVFIVALIIGIYQGLLARWFSSFSMTIEFLCDDCGAEIAGILPALRAEFLVSKHSEILSDAYYQLLKAKREGKIINAKNLSALLEESLTYDCVSSEELSAQLEKNINRHQENVSGSFFNHFKSQIMSDTLDTEHDLEDEFIRLSQSRKAKIVDLPTHEGELSLDWFKVLISLVRENPALPIFRTPNDMNDDDSSHPGPRRRLVYLWQEFVESLNITKNS